jgi:7 transmembrane sweet-taste receptor of 3 GCPR/5'-nucleotidase, C-terminal domain
MLSNIWETLPFPNTLCTGQMSGISLFRLLDYSIRVATFTYDHTNEADSLLQVAGLKITYNENIQQGSSRLVAVDVWNRELKIWNVLDPSSLYTFVTFSFECSQHEPYTTLTGADGSFTILGEQAGVVGEVLVQDVVKDYLQQLTEPYNTTLEGRIFGTSVAAVNATLNLIQDENDCSPTEYYSTYEQVCKTCPDTSQVTFSDKIVTFQYQLGREVQKTFAEVEYQANPSTNNVNTSHPNDPTADKLSARILLVNRGQSNFSVIPKLIPSWMKIIHPVDGGSFQQFTSETQNFLLHVPSGASLVLILMAVPGESQVAGLVRHSVSFGVIGIKDSNTDPGSATCDEVNQMLTFDATLTILPQQDLNQLGGIRFLGLSFMAVAQLSSLGFGLFVGLNRKTRIISTMQPHFLNAICLGIFIMSSTILPLSFDDGILTISQCNGMCVAIPWLFATGSTIVFTIMFAKLWRINRLFGAQRFQRLVVTEREVLGPFLLLFATNVTLLTAWTIVDPFQWTRNAVPGEEWKTYGACTSQGIGYIFMGLIAFVLFVALVLACHQAYKARNISDEFSESKNLGLAIFTWLQVLLVGVPTMFLVSQENFTARYFIQVGLLFVLSESMLLVIFVPLVRGVTELKKNRPSGQGVAGVSGISGETPNGHAAHRPAIVPVRALEVSATMPKESDLGGDISALSGAGVDP